MGYCINFIFIDDGRTNGYRSWSFTVRYFFQKTRFMLFVDIILAMVSYVNKRRIKFHQWIYGIIDGLNAFPLTGGSNSNENKVLPFAFLICSVIFIFSIKYQVVSIKTRCLSFFEIQLSFFVFRELGKGYAQI